MTRSPSHARILVIGHSCLDSIALSPQAPPEDGKLQASSIWCGSGGPAANAAIALSRMGHSVRLATQLGDDDAGRLIAAGLQAEGIELLCPAVSGGKSSQAQIRARAAQRSVLWKRGQLPPLPAGDMQAWLDGVGLVYVDGHEVAAASAALREAGRMGIATVSDAGSLRDGAAEWPALLDSCMATVRWLAGRFPDASSVTAALDALVREARPAALVGVSMGEQGGFARVGDEHLVWAARKVGVVDSTVAGDAFHAGLADALLQEMEAQQALDWAATLAAAACRGPGHTTLPRDRDQLALWHGRWGYRERPEPDLLDAPLNKA
ncbi:hypothetical protein DRQ32_04730, partial [bacterium]